MRFLPVFLVLLYLLLPAHSRAQQRLAGRLTDAESGEPVSGATIYIDNTQLRVASDRNGVFSIARAPVKGTLVLTHVGYEKTTVELQPFADSLRLPLARRAAALDGVSVKAKAAEGFKKWGRLFTEYFIGGPEAAPGCRLRNPEALRFYFDPKSLTLKAFARTQLVLDNETLGYRVHVDLDEFVYNFRSGYFSYGVSRFTEPLPAPDSATVLRRAAARLLAYRGSKMHFGRALFDTSLAAQGFHLYKYVGRVNAERARVEALLLERKGSESQWSGGGYGDLSLGSYARDSAAHYARVMAGPAYFFEDTLALPLTARWSKGGPDLHRFRFGTDSLLLFYRERPGTMPTAAQLSARAQRRLAGGAEHVNFFQDRSVSGRFTLLYLRGDSLLGLQSNGFIANKAALVTEGDFAGRRAAYDLPWDYDPVADERLLLGRPLPPGRSARIDSAFRRVATAASPTSLYLHLDKAVYDVNDNIWFAAYLLASPVPLEAQHSVFVLLSDPATGRRLASAQFVLASGLGAGALTVPDSLHSGRYLITAYTNQFGTEGAPALFRQSIRVRGVEPAFRIRTDEEAPLLRHDSLYFRPRLYDGRSFFAEGAPVRWWLRSGDRAVDSGRSTTGAYGAIALPGQPLARIGGRPLVLRTEVGHQGARTTLVTDLPLPRRIARLRWYPEGGYAVQGLPARLPFEIRDEQGAPLALQLEWQEDGRPTDSLRSDASGYGIKAWTPKAGRSYRVRALADSVLLLGDAPPAPLPSGATLEVAQALLRDTLLVTVRSTDSTATAYLLLHDHQTEWAQVPLLLEGGTARVALPVSALPPGPATLTLFDAAGRPLAERALWKEGLAAGSVEIQADSVRYGTRSHVKLRLRSLDSQGNPVPATFSLAAIVAARRDTTLAPGIESFALAHRYEALGLLAGAPAPDTSPAGLEHYLLTRGWTRLRWLDLAQEQALPKGPSLDQQGVVLFDERPLKRPADLILVHDKGFYGLRTDSSGRFRIGPDSMTAEDGWELRLSLDQQYKTGWTIRLFNPNDSVQETLAGWVPPLRWTPVPAPVDDPSTRYKMLANVTVQSGGGDESGPGRRADGNCLDWVCMNNFLNCKNHPTGRRPQVGQTYFKQGKHGYGPIVYRGCADGGNGPAPVFQYAFRGRWYAREFYVADYSVHNPPAPETASTVFWTPQVQTDDRGEARLSFWTNDLDGPLVLHAEGIHSNGVLAGKTLIRVGK